MLQLGSTRLYGISRGIDSSTDQALTIATTVRGWFPFADTAIVDGFDGLAIFNEEWALDVRNKSVVTGIHFQNAACGYAGTPPLVAAHILDLFGFESYQVLREKLQAGGIISHLTLRREVAPARA